jgi:hypothetical protein
VTDLDSLIDAAAREMTTAPSPVNLRASVVDEISGRSQSEAWFHLSWLAAAAGIVLAAYLGWPALPTIEFPPPPMARTQGELRPPTPNLIPQPTRLRDAPAPAPRSLDARFASIPALAGPDAIGIAPLDVTSETLPALDAVEPLEVKQLDITPLTSPPAATGGQ